MECVTDWIREHKDREIELIAMRRYLHQNAEVGSMLPLSKEYVEQRLSSWGYQPKRNPNGSIEALVGTGSGKVLLLRADMDALPMCEKTNLSFRSINGNMHACGHDLHTAMLLETARLLKEEEYTLEGRVKLVFQPHEEGLIGCKKMLEDGIMEHPHVDAAIGMHVLLGTEDEVGTIRTIKGEMTASSTIFEIEVFGKRSHGSMPEDGIDAMRVAVHIYQALQELIPKETYMHHASVLTIGVLTAGSAHNIIPDHAYMKCSLRCFQNEDQVYLMKRICELSEGIASLYHAHAEIKVLQEAPCIVNDPEFMEEIQILQRPLFSNRWYDMQTPLSMSEDFAHISKLVPSVFVTLSCGRKQDGYAYGHHHECAIFDEGCMMYGTYFLYSTARQWLKLKNM